MLEGEAFKEELDEEDGVQTYEKGLAVDFVWVFEEEEHDEEQERPEELEDAGRYDDDLAWENDKGEGFDEKDEAGAEKDSAAVLSRVLLDGVQVLLTLLGLLDSQVKLPRIQLQVVDLLLLVLDEGFELP